MIQKSIEQHLDIHLISLQEGLNRYAKHAVPRWMHQVRVDMKYIRAVFFLLEDAKGGKIAHRTHQQVKRMFADAGQVREYQLDIAWFRLHRKTMLLRLLKRISQLKKANAHFLGIIPGSLRKLKKAEQKAKALLKKTSEKDVLRYIRSLLQEVLSALDPAWPEAQWHDLRKHVKGLMIAGRWLAVEKPVSAAVNIFMADLDLLQKTIGNWHDFIILDQAIQGIQASADHPAIVQRETSQATKILASEIRAQSVHVRQTLSVMRQRWVLGTR
jgi:hypothetical protein